MNTVSVYGLLIVAAWCSFPSPAAAQFAPTECTAEDEACTYGSDTCSNGTFCYPPEIDYNGGFRAVGGRGEPSCCQECFPEGEECSGAVGRGECCSGPEAEIKCDRARRQPKCIVVCRGVGGECREGRGAKDCCQPYGERYPISCLKSNSSGRFTCTEALGIYERCGRDAQFNSSTPCAAGLSCVERNALVTAQEYAQQVHNTSDLGVLGGAVSDLQLKRFVCDPLVPPRCIQQGGPCTANYKGQGNCCSDNGIRGAGYVAYCRNDTAVLAGSPVYNGVCADCRQQLFINCGTPRGECCTSDDQCCSLAGGYCRGIFAGIFEHRTRCLQCAGKGDFCNGLHRCCNPNDTCRGNRCQA